MAKLLVLYRYLSISHEHHIAPRFKFVEPTLYPPAPQTTLQYFLLLRPLLPANPEQYLSLSSRLVTGTAIPLPIARQKVRDLCMVPRPHAWVFGIILTAKVTIRERAPSTQISRVRGVPGPIPRRTFRTGSVSGCL